MRRESFIRNYKQEFDAKNAWGILSSIDIHHCDPSLIRDEAAIKDFVQQLCELIEMKRFGDTVVVHFGEDERVAGFSMTQLIETSLISAHFANQTNNVYLDIFSCKYYEPEVVAEFSKTFFKGENYNMNVVLRK
jgi:S-adenosylmethionine decarboxylase